MRTENTLHLRSLILVLLMLTSFTVPLLSPFEPSEDTELENQSQRYETTPPTTSDTSVAMMLKDIRTGSASSSISQIRVISGSNGNSHTAFFKANNGTGGEELWKSDGTPEGTMLVKDIRTGGGDAEIDQMTVVGSTLFFRANDGSNSSELWKSDGTPQGTVMVKDINPGSNSSDPNYLTAVGDLLFFRAIHPGSGCELWVSDGTSSGTFMLKDIYSGAHPNNGYPESLTAVGNNLYFTVYDAGYQLWKSNGTTAGTTLVKIIASSNGRATELTALGNTLFFSATNPSGTSTGDELWASEGTDSSTWMVKDINSGTSSSSPKELEAVGNTLYFKANDGSNGDELWKSNGTESGTMMVKDIDGASSSSLGSYPDLTAVGNLLFFDADDGTGKGTELWKSDGTSVGTVMVKDIRSGSASSDTGYFSASGSTLYFDANDGINGHELWKTDGTTGGTVMVKDIYSGATSSNPQRVFTSASGVGYFKADDGVNGVELWKIIDNPCYINGTIINNATQWGHCVGGNNEDVEVASVAVDSSGDTYYAGSFGDFALFGDIPLYSSGGSDIFIAKLSSNGSWQWAKKAGSSGNDEGTGIAVDSSGNAYVTGSFGPQTATFGSTSLASSGSKDVFVAKLSSSGSWQWVVKAGSSGNDEGAGIAVDSSGNAYVTGSFGPQTATFGSTSLVSSGSIDIFIAKLSSSGSWQWAVKAGGSGYDYGYGIAVHSSGKAYFTGFFHGTATFGSTSLVSSGSTDIFIAKLSSSGTWQWAVKAGGSSDDEGTGIAVDSSGNAYFTGYFQGTATFGSTSLVSIGSTDIFIAKLSPVGSWQWAVKVGGSSSDVGYGIDVDSNGNSYVAGMFDGTLTIGSVTLTSGGDGDPLLGIVDSSGSWQFLLGGANGAGDQKPSGIAYGSNGDVFLIGNFQNNFFHGDGVSSEELVCNNGQCSVFVKLALGIGGDTETTPIFDHYDYWGNSTSKPTRSVVWGDIDGDGDLDLAVGNDGQSNEVFFNSNGQFVATTPGWTSNNGMDTKSVAWGDVDGDGDLDLAVGNDGQSNEVFFNTGTTLASTPAWTSSNSLFTTSIAWGDVDGDGDLDLAVGNTGANNEVYLNDGNSLATTPAWTSNNSQNTHTLAWGDIDGDGDLDLAVGNYGTQNEIYLNTGTSLATAPAWTGGGNRFTKGVSWGDVDGDGDLDLAVGNHNYKHEVYLNNEGTLASTNTWESPDITGNTHSVAWGDLDGDGDLDLTIGQAAGSSFPSHEAYLNNNGTLSSNSDWNSGIGVNVQTRSIALGDIDGDGDLDLAAGIQNGVNKIYHNQIDGGGAGTDGLPDIDLGGGLSPAIFNSNGDWNSSNSLWTYSVAWGDADSDGDLDLAVGNADESWGNTLYSNGGSALSTTHSWSSSNSYNMDTRSVSWGDVDGDGDLDLAVGNFGDQNEIYLNSATGLASTPDWTSTNSLQTYSVAWGDVDGDGDLDLAVGNDQANNEVYLNSNGEFATSADWTSENSLNTRVVVWVDVDSDGDFDLSVGNADGNNEIYLNSGTSLAAAPDWTSSNSLSTSGVAWGDIDDDGDPDMVVANDGGSNELYLSNNGVLANTPAWTSNNSLSSKSIALGDVDGDGDLDMAVGNYNQNNEVYLYSNGAFSTTPAWTGALTQKTFSVAWGDVDGDGDLDLAIGEQQSKNQVYLNQLDSGGAGDDGLPDIDLGGPQPIFHSTADWTNSNTEDTDSVAWGDVDGDGDLDLAVGNWNGYNEVYLNSGTALATTPAWTSSNSLYTASVAWGDMDGDGDLDLAVGNFQGNNEVYLNSGTALATTPAWTSSNSLKTNSVVWGDVDGDGDLDLAVGNYNENNEVYLNSGTSLATTPAWTSNNTLRTYPVAWGDVDGDGDLDLAVGNQDQNNEVYLNSGTVLATTPTWISSNSLDTRSVAWGDVDGDGDLDLAVGNSGQNNEVYLNSGTSLATTPAWTSSNSLKTNSVAWGDVDGDGDLDLAVGNQQQNNEVYLNSGTALAILPSWTSSNSLDSSSVAWGDADGDGDLDLAAGAWSSTNEVYLNQLNDGGAGVDGLPDIDLGGPSSGSQVVKQDITVGMHHSCGILSNGSAMCWGGNPDGQLGHGGGTADYYFPVEVDIPGGRTVMSISAGNFHTCAILDDGKAMCWGNGYDGRLGNNNTDSWWIPVYVDLPEGRDAVGISAGSYHTCAVLDDGSAVCWGLNDVGQLGDGTTDSAQSPVYVVLPGGRTASSIDAGDSHSCAVLDNGSAVCWGAGNTGMLGNGDNQNQNSPVYVTLSEGDSVSQISAGKEFTCAVMDDADTKCWGNGGSRLGAGAGQGSTWVPISTVHSSYTSASVISVSTGDDSACSLMDNGSVMCWGNRDGGQLGDGETSGDVANPVYVNMIQGNEFVAISMGIAHSCGLMKNDQAMCWGNNVYGKLGTNGYDDSPIPVFVYGEHDWNGGGGAFHHLQPNLYGLVGGDNFAMSVGISTLSANVGYDFRTTVAWELSEYIELNVYSGQSLGNSWPAPFGNKVLINQGMATFVPSRADHYQEYCVEVQLRLNNTGDFIGYGQDCTDYYGGYSDDSDWAADDHEDAWATLTNNPDTDSDGVDDWLEYWFGGDPGDGETEPSDADGDGLPEQLERALGTSDSDEDSDNDGTNDADEFFYGGDPLDGYIWPNDYDYDDCFDEWEDEVGLNSSNPDSDGDGVFDCFENEPLDPNDTPTDSDGDGLPDSLEAIYGTNPNDKDSDDDFIPDSAEVGAETDPLNNQSVADDFFTNWDHNLVDEVSLSVSTSSSAPSYPPSNMIDNDFQTSWWSNGGCPQWIEIDLGGVFRVANIGVVFDDGPAADYPRELDVDVKENLNDSWTTLLSLNHTDGDDLTFGLSEHVVPKKTRYIRFNCLDSTDAGGTVHAFGIKNIEIYDSRFTQFADIDAIDNYTGIGGGGQGSGQPSISAHLEIDSLNETLEAGYSLFDLNIGEDYDIDWRLIEAEQGNCPAEPDVIDSGSFSIIDWDSIQQGQIEYLIDHEPGGDWQSNADMFDWYGEYCLQLELSQDGTSIDVEWLYLNASSGQSSGSNSDADGDGVDDVVDLCFDTPTGTEVDADGCPLGSGVDSTSILDVEFNERQEDSIWYQSFTVIIDDPWLGFNHSMSLKFNDENGNTLYSYFSPMDDEDTQGGWWRLSTDMDEDPEEWNIDLNWEGLTSGSWEGSKRFFEDTEYPYFEAGNYCVEVSLGYQANITDTPMGSVKNLYDKAEFCFTFEHDSMAGVEWDGTEEEEKGLIDKLASNAIIGPLLAFMDSTTGQIVSVLLGVLAFAGRMVLARGQRSKNKRVRKFSDRIRKAETIGRLKILEQDVEKANDKNKLPRGGFGDLMEQIETRMEKLGFDGQPEDGGTSGDWSSDDGANEWQDDFQQAADMMWDAQDMMADAKEEAAMARHAIEDMQQQMGHQPRRKEPEPEPEEQFTSRYVTEGIDDSEAGAAGPSLPGGRMMDLDGDGRVTEEEKQIWASMSDAEKEQFFSPITNIAEEIRRRNLLNEKREKMNLKKSSKKDKKRNKKGKKDKRW